jgi:polar amino acid transport system substrate-binding protein
MTGCRRLALALALCLSTPAQAGATLDRVRHSGVLTTLVITDYPPFGFINARNELDGFDIDTAEAVASRLGVGLKLANPGWETIVSGRWQGRWDLCVCSMSPTDERAKVLNFPATYYSSPAWLVVNKDEQAIKSIADISGKRVGVGTGSTYEAYVNKTLVIAGGKPLEFPFHDVIVVPGDETVNFRNLALGPGLRLDAIVSDLATAKGNIEATHALKLVGTALYGEPNAVATDKGDPDWDAEVARVIAELEADGTLGRISQKWFGADITRQDE